MSQLVMAGVITQQLHDSRNALRTILGEKYSDRVAPVRQALRIMAKHSILPLIECALQCAKKMDADGQDPSLIFAALVDELGAGA